MVLTPSTMNRLGVFAPDFKLPDVVTGKMFSLADFRRGGVTPPLLVMFICHHCPYVQHVQDELSRIGKDYEKKDIAIVAISSNDAEKYPDDAPKYLKAMGLEKNFKFPYLYDATQEVAKAYRAACTPDFFLYARDSRGEVTSPLQLVYRGQLDDSRPGNGKPVTGSDLRAAMEAVLSGQPPVASQKPSIGCNIKWKPGNEPTY